MQPSENPNEQKIIEGSQSPVDTNITDATEKTDMQPSENPNEQNIIEGSQSPVNTNITDATEKSVKVDAVSNNKDYSGSYGGSPMGSVGSSAHYPRLEGQKGEDKCIEKFLVILSYIVVIICFPFSLFCIFVLVRQFERCIILRHGKVYKNRPVGPGLIHYLPCVDHVKYTDLRIISYEVPPQEALTKDSLTVSVDAVVYYKIFDPVCAVINVASYKTSTQFLSATTLRNSLGTRKLTELLDNRPAVSYQVFLQMKHIAREWGIKIVRVEMKDIRLPIQLQKAMAAEAESARLANAKIIVAQAEIECTKSLQIATTTLMDNPLCMQLRYLQSLQTIAGDKTNTIVFPFASDLIKKLLK